MILGIFDSGLGGLTVLREIIKNNSYDKIIYFGDTKNLPYGEKDKETLLKMTRFNIDFLRSKGADEIVVACGTISSNTLDIVKDDYDFRIIGIIDALCNEAVKKTLNNKIGVIATEATINTHIFSKKIKDKEVYEVPCPKFTPLIEAGMIDSKEMDEALDEYLSPLKEKDIDTLIMGCTHYPLLEDKIKDYFNKPINIINSGTIIAEELFNGETKIPEIEFYVSGNKEEFKEHGKRFIDVKEIDELHNI